MLIENLATMGVMKDALNKAITVAGGINPFCAAVKAPSVHAVKAWRMTRIPAEYCPVIERVTGVRCEELRPDMEWSVVRHSQEQAVA